MSVTCERDNCYVMAFASANCDLQDTIKNTSLANEWLQCESYGNTEQKIIILLLIVITISLLVSY